MIIEKIKNILLTLARVFEDLIPKEAKFLDLKKFNEIILENQEQSLKIVALNEQLIKIQLENNELIKGLEVINEEQEDNQEEKYFNNKWEKGDIIYKAKGRYSRDVRTYLFDKSTILKNIVDSNKLIGDSDDETVYNCEQFVNSRLKYVTDKIQYEELEYWQNPEETIQRGVGDCEDYSILIKSLCLVAGVPDYKMKVCAGNTSSGGHAYCIYLRECDNEWVTVEGSFYPTKKKIDLRILHKQNERYGSIWFTFNKEFSFIQNSVEITGRFKDVEGDIL